MNTCHINLINFVFILIIHFDYSTTLQEFLNVKYNTEKLLNRSRRCSRFNFDHLLPNLFPIHSQTHKNPVDYVPQIWSENSSLYILGSTKEGDRDKILGTTLHNFRMFSRYWNNYTVILYTDAESYYLYRKIRDPCIYLVRESFIHESRTHRLAYARNQLLDYTAHFIKAKNENPNNVYFIMMDMDGVNGNYFNQNIFEKVMSQTHEWDSLTFYRNHFYDIWALRYGQYDYNALYRRINGTSVIPMIEQAIKRDINAAKLSYFPVYSAFNGFGIYKYNKTIGCRYQGSNPEFSMETEDCEHVALHKCMIRIHGAKIRIYNESISGG